MPGQLAADFQNIPAPNYYHFREKTFEKVLALKKSGVPGGALLNIINFLLALLLSRFVFPGDILPAGLSFGLYHSERSRKVFTGLPVITGIFLGLFSVKGMIFAGGAAACLVIHYVIAVFYKYKKGHNLNKPFIFGIWAVLRFGLALYINQVEYALLITGLELILSFILTIFWRIVYNYLDNPLQAFSKYTVPALSLTLVFALGGVKGIGIYSINLAEFLAVFLLLLVSYLGGGGVGAAMGISVAMVLGVNTKDLITLAATYGIAGFLGGLLKDLRKWGTVLGAGMGLYLSMLQLPKTAFPETILPWGIGMMAFILIPRRYFTQLSFYFHSDIGNSGTAKEQKQLREIITNRLNDLADIFVELAKSFNEGFESGPASQKMDLYSLLERVCTKNCQHCNGYENCWGENFYSTYREIFDLIAYAELYGEVNSKYLKGRLAKNCFQQFKLLATINSMFERCRTDHLWQRKLDESKAFLASQLQGISGMINNLAAEVFTDACFKTELEEKIRYGFNRVGLAVHEVSVLSFGEQGLEINIKQHRCHQRHECQYLAAAMISRLLDRDYTIWERSCQLENGNCSYSLIPSRNFEIKTTVCKLPTEGNQLSGDNHMLHELKSGHFVAILSDGMGHGPKAAVESSTTVNILERLLETGVDKDFAVKMVNSVLLLRSPEESFATIDLATIDLYTAKAEFVKIGAAVTYIKRGREIWSIQSTSMPAGVLDTVDLERTVLELKPGDLVIMATDGVVESKINQSGKEDWMVRALKQVEVVGPEALGEYLLNMAKINQDGTAKDDMTVIVLQLLEKVCPV